MVTEHKAAERHFHIYGISVTSHTMQVNTTRLDLYKADRY